MIIGNDILPDATGRSLGAQDARWDAKLRNVDVSGIITGQFTALAIFKLTPKIVPWSANPVFDGLDHNTGFKMVLTGATVPSFNNIAAGQLVSVVLIQDATGGRTFLWPGNVRGGMDIGQAPNEASGQLFWCDGTTLWAMTPGEIQ